MRVITQINMESSAILIFLVLGSCVVSLNAVMFGTSGTALHINDDGYSSAISIPGGYPFFGNTQSRLYVCTNGIISFGSGVSSFTPYPFPIANNPVVAPFWGDVDTRRGGNVYYRTASQSDLNTMVSAIGFSSYSPTWGYVVSWVDVAAYGGGGPRNTFQAALCTDGSASFVIFNFQSVSWTYGSASGGTPAQMGFDAGDGSNSYSHEWSRSSSISSLPASSNVGVTGRYIYGVASAVIQPIDEVVVDPCEGVTCSGRGTCSEGTCSCNTGYEGSNCETTIQWCSVYGITCNGRGTCSNTGDNTSWQCSCVHNGYYGTQCENIVDWCTTSSITCSHEATCSNNANNDNWQCTCRHEGYYGSLCETIRDWCTQEGQTCNDHGTCSNAADNVYWQCTCRHSGYYGTECENIVDWCTTDNEDCNGNGVCSNEPDNEYWVCACYEGFIDTDCDDQLCLGGIYCHNNGVCGANGCQCISPWAGEDCTEENAHCTGVDCGHGSCTGTGQCSCHDGYAQLSASEACTGQTCGGFNCYNGATCVQGVCSCAVGWLGDTCEEYDLCAGTTCNGHGVCVVYNAAPVCRCDDSSFGPETGDLESQCSQQTCSNDVVCNNGGLCNGNGGCTCVYPYTGDTCTTVDYCSGIDCGYGDCSTTDSGFVCSCTNTAVWVDPNNGLCTTTVCDGGYQFCRNTATCQAGNTCSCPNGYSGDSCEIWDPCYDVTCMNDGTCRDNQHNVDGDFLCDCADGFHGRYCELQRCVNGQTCYNGGHCTDTGCECSVEWTGDDCQTAVPSVCQNHYCGVGGTCSGDASPICTCEAGYTQDDEASPCNLICADLSCQNGGVCNADAPYCQCPPGYYGETCGLASPCGSVECHDARGSCGDYQGDLASCQCVLPIYTGDDCSTELCSSGPQAECLNGGSCTDSGCECPYPYEGSNCGTVNYCPDNRCVHGTCASLESDSVCECDEGYIKDPATGLCTTQYTCTDGRTFCMNNGACNAAGDGCDCTAEYSGDNCETRDLCAGVTCTDHGTCVEQPMTVDYTCSCDEGWVGGLCQYHRCSNDIVCHNGAACGEDGCICTPGWTGDDCSEALHSDCYTDTENYECGYGSCDAGPTCTCDDGYLTDTDGRCVVVSCNGVACQNGAECVGNVCDCPVNYYGADCSDRECEDIDCGNNGHCHMMNDVSNECVCDDPRWTGDNCEIETCSSGAQCQNGGSCVNGDAPCTCLPGFSGDNCETVSVCEGYDCLHGTCVNVDSAPFCRCETGYIEDPNTGLCSVELCGDGVHFCMNDQPCSGDSGCSCSGAYSGDNCEIVDYCYDNTCTAHGTCRLAVDTAGNSLFTHECICEDGFHGSNCQYQSCVDDVVCFNGGTCRSTGCECTAEWQGPSCEVSVPEACDVDCLHGECDDAGDCQCYTGYTVGSTGVCDANAPTDGVCASTTCYNGGTCTVVTNLLTSEDEPICACVSGFAGADCSTVDDCSVYDCSGHGTCVMYQDTTPRCYCDDPRYTASNDDNLDCDLETCSDNSVCNNGGSCQADGSCSCIYPYEGDRCETRNVCPDSQCVHGTCSEGSGDFMWDCVCDSGYIYNEITGYCDIMLCADHVEFCQNGGTCEDGDTTSTCSCPDGVSGDNCETVDHCYNVDCHSGWCENQPTTYVCRCLEGFTGADCSLQHCVEDVTCFNDGICGLEGCRCTDDWEGESCEIPRAEPCVGIECGHGSCVQDGDTYSCECDSGFSQSDSTSPCVIEVCEVQEQCQHGGTCVPPSGNDPESCSCMPGYLGENCEIVTCLNVDCHGHGRCVELPNGAGQCVCDHSRWTHSEGDDATPGDCSEETQNGVSCQNGGSCVDACEASPPCSCPWPYVGNNCETAAVCDDSWNTCVHGTCYEEARDGRDFWCYCDEGYIVDSDTGTCVTQMCDTGFCQHEATCNADELSCACPAGTSGDNCETVDLCHERDCTGHGTCRVIDGTSYSCACEDGWVGVDCELQMCTDGVTCFNGGSCTTTFGCECAAGFGGPSCEVVYSDDCAALACVHGVCDDSGDSATCECYAGWGGDDCNSHVCTDEGLSCANGGTCVDGVGDVTTSLTPENTCLCMQPYGGADCSQVDPCASMDCSLHGHCIVYNDEAQCVCDDARWTGDNCERESCVGDGSDVCQNGGSCLSDGSCACAFPFQGDRCENTDYCLDNPCGNGYCAVNGEDFECDCYDGYTQGVLGTCDTQWCTDGARFCMNGGTCIDWDTYSTCTCPPGVTGENCETVDHCYAQDCSGHGVCDNSVSGGGYTCTCLEGWLGQDCSQQRCQDVTCMNGGVCGAEGCRCPTEWTGESCETRVDPNCQYVECGQHGACTVASAACASGSSTLSAALDAAEVYSPDTSDLDQLYSLDLGAVSIITGLDTRGGAEAWVTTFTAETSIDGTTWSPIRSLTDSSYKLFSSAQGDTALELTYPIVARYVRLNPRTWSSAITMVAQINGCGYEENGVCECEDPYVRGAEGACSAQTCSDSFQCNNGGTCYTAYDGSPACYCLPGFLGRDCSSSPCEEFDCHNHGRCVVLPNGDASCVCDHSRWTHDESQGQDGLCALEECGNGLVCQNGGSCLPRPTDESTVCVCPYPYTGEQCETYELCSTNPCVHGDCHTERVYGTDSHCYCDENYIVDPDTQLCTTEMCANGEMFCMNGGTCNAAGDGCECPDSTTGVNCEDVDYCHGRADCTGHGHCVEVQTGATRDTATDYECVCEEGWQGRECDQQRCNDDVTCMNGGWCRYDGCVCAEGWGGESCEIALDSACYEPEVYNCGYHGYCVQVDGELGCECYNGYSTNADDENPTCNVHTVDDLTCYNGGTVGVVNGEARCWCTDLYEGDLCDIPSPCANFECSDNARCILDENNDPTCACAHTRWSGDQCEIETCQDSTTCLNGGSCISSDAGSYTCACIYPYTGSDCGSQDYCSDVERACSQAIRCNEQDNDYTCECNYELNSVRGYVNNDVTGMCTTQTCGSGDNFCLNNGECVDNDDGSSWCHCPEHATGEHCETVDFCFRVDCSLHGDCESRPQFNDHVCHCYEGWLGADCSMQLCTEGVTCLNNGVCGPEGCRCTAGWTGDSCEEPVDLRCQGAPDTEHGECIPDEVDYTVSTTGCSCWFDEERTDCACCEAGGCVCGETQPYRCVACGDTQACDRDLSVDVSDQRTWQSTTEGDGVSDYAIDSTGQGTCTATLHGEAINTHHNDWWTVDMGAAYRVYYIVLYNSETNPERLSSVNVVLLGDMHNPLDAEVSSLCTYREDYVPYSVSGQTLYCDAPVVGRYLSLMHVNNTDSLTICDIEIYGDRPFTIECEHGYENQDGDVQAVCDVQVCDFATNRTCENGGSCLANNTCSCNIGYHGEFCQYSGCAGVDCYGHGRCETLYNEEPLCLCDHSRWTHDVNLDTNAEGVGNCALETCPNDLVCYNGGSCISSGESYECQCTYHWSGATCEDPVPCPEGADTCINGLQCLDGELTDFSCICEEDYIVHPDTGECTTRICDDGFGGEHMCMHGGTCVLSDDASQGCECPDGIYGANCEHVDWCYNVDCSGHGLCRNNSDSYHCACDEGWIGTDCNMQRCDDYFTCFNGARCQADGWNQGCNCEENYYDEMCESFDHCLDVDCGHGTCTADNEGFDYTCECEENWQQSSRDSACDNLVTECAALPAWVEPGDVVVAFCQYAGECAPESVFYEYEPYYVNYTADPNYEGDLEGIWVQPENRTVANLTCACPSDRLGVQCEIDNECSRVNCSNHGTCNPGLDGSATCICDAGHEGDNCQIHVCSDAVTRCYNGGSCSLENLCTCVYPFTGDSCEETDWCTFAPGWEMDCYNGYCSSRENGFLCVCDSGYIRNQDTGECTTELCNEEEDTFCMNHGTCNDEFSNCTCHEEWIDHNCETYNWCWNQTCSLRGDCINFEFDYNCSCFPGFYGRDCELQACYEGVTCRNNSLCSTSGCQCADGYTGIECDVLDPCASVDCGPGGVCVENNTLENPRFEPPYWTAGYYCEASGSGYLQASDDSDSPFNVVICDEASGVYCYNEGSCVRVSRRPVVYACECADGFYADDCSVSNPCDPEPCFGHGTCHVNDDLSYNCTCEAGYEGDDCSVNRCDVTDVLCMNGGTCPFSDFADQACSCPFPYTGHTCEVIDYCADVDCAQGYCDPENGTCVCDEGWIRDYNTGHCTTSVCNRSNMFCMNNGTCTEGEYTCECHDWFNYNEWNPDVDVHCEHWNYCFDQTCSGHGTCINGDDGFTCDCDLTFFGTLCSQQYCVDEVACQNGGLCTASGCDCPSDYSGDDCSVYNRCAGIDCGVGQCVVMPTLEEGCFEDMLGDYLESNVDDEAIAITSSSFLNADTTSSDAVTTSGSAWVADSGDAEPWVQIDFGREIIAHSWFTLGREDADEWTTSYNLSYSLDAISWSWIRNPRDRLFGYRTFEGNTDRNTPVGYNFSEPMLLRFVRFLPVSTYGAAAIRVDVQGCPYNPAGYECNCTAASEDGTWVHYIENDVNSACSAHQCDHSFSDGQRVLCYNHGFCLPEGQYDSAAGDFCNCSTGFTGPFCDIVDECHSQDDSETLACNGRGGNCSFAFEWDSEQGAVTSHEFTCDCEITDTVSYSGATCGDVLCNDTISCQNGASCSRDMDACECQHPYTGDHCERIDYCASIDCEHGLCVAGDSGFECICNEGNQWMVDQNTGLCTTYVCNNEANFCMNQGFCSDEYEYESTRDICLCTDFGFGEHCELPNECGYERACNNRGVCSRTTAECTCEGSEYSGTACETELCSNDEFCYNGGSCIGNGEECDCVYPFNDGARCETQNWCDGMSCYMGTCETFEDGFMLLPEFLVTGGFNCSCNDGYTIDTTGVTSHHLLNCTTEICGDGSLCHNRGECSQGGNSYSCNCADGYSGGDCSELAADSESSSDDSDMGTVGAIVGSLAGTAGVAGGAGSLLALLRRRRKNKEEPEAKAHEDDDLDIEEMEVAPNSAAPVAFNLH